MRASAAALRQSSATNSLGRRPGTRGLLALDLVVDGEGPRGWPGKVTGEVKGEEAIVREVRVGGTAVTALRGDVTLP